MYLTDFYVERFGDYFRIGVDGLAAGLNLLFDHSAIDRSPVVEFLRTMFLASGRKWRGTPCDSPLVGCTGFIGLQTAHGRQTISHRGDESNDAWPILETVAGAFHGDRSADGLADLSRDLLTRAFLVDFQQKLGLEELIAAASRDGISVGKRLSKQHRLVLERELTAREGHVAVLRREIASVERLLGELDQRRCALESRLAKNHSHESDPNKPAELEAIDTELRRWTRTLRDVISRRKKLAEECDALQKGPHRTERADANLCAALMGLESRIEQLRQTSQKIGSDTPVEVQASITQELSDLHDHLLEAGAAYKQRQLEQRYRRKSADRRQFVRCEFELRNAIRILAERRCMLIERLARTDKESPKSASTAAKDTSARPQPPQVKPRSNAVESSLRRELAEVKSELKRLAEVRLKWIAEVDAWELDLADRRAELVDPGTPSAVLENASEYLHRLSAGNCGTVQLDDDGEVTIRRGMTDVRYRELDSGSRDQTYLAISLAVAFEHKRLGSDMPLVINAPFTHFPSQHVRSALELLAELGRKQQIVCITRHEHVASVARLLNIPIHSIACHESIPARYFANQVASFDAESQTHFRRRANEIRIDERAGHSSYVIQELPGPLWGASRPRDDFSRGPRAIAQLENVTRLLSGNDRSNNLSSHLADSFLAADSRTGWEKGYSSANLHEDDPIERTPSLDPVNAERLRRIGLLRVGDLLRVNVDEIADDLRPSGVTPAMIESWRSQARLGCAIPGLGAYDARILVGCGIRSPDQLASMLPSNLRNRVKEFASSAEGQAVLLSGTEFELSRVTDWINGAREFDGRPAADAGTCAEETTTRETRRERRRPRKTSNQATAHRRHERIDDRLSSGVKGEYYLCEMDRLSAIPWIAESTLTELRDVGIATIGDLLGHTAQVIAEKLCAGRISIDLVRQWQQQAALVCRVARLRLDDARILVAIGVMTLEQLAATPPKDLWHKVSAYCESDGHKLALTSDPPSRDEVSRWVIEAQRARMSHAA